ncbi:MAG: NAD-dependent epimerase/dehydratase family protein [Verrucomicrobia bacterium]|nr:NAD-dependent epimerase/dehydratase family protein [Verrucomicrobiota bacterium]
MLSEKSAESIICEDLDFICDELRDEFVQLLGKKLLIVGGAGFLGYYLVQAALHLNEGTPDSKSVEVTVFDNFIRGVPDWLTQLEVNPSLQIIRHDITQPLPADLPAFDFVIHAASIASPTYYRKFPIQTMDANVSGLRLILDYCLKQRDEGSPVSGILYFSTSEIYGDPTPENIPTSETYRGNVSCTGPRACYDESKRYGETLCVNFAQQFDLPVRIARPFNNYGPGLKITDKRVLPDFARDVLGGRDIVMLSDGSPTRTFCYIADAIVGYFKVLILGRNGESYNIGTERPEISIAELAKRVVEASSRLFGYEGKVVKQNSQESDYLVDNPSRRCPLISKAREELGFDPKIGIVEGLDRALCWYRENSEAEEA